MAATERFVLDASVALAWCFPDEKAPYPQQVLDSLTRAPGIVPPLWPFEVSNALLMGERRKRCTHADVAMWTTFLQALPIDFDDESRRQAWNDTLTLARAQALSVYDAAYLELALRLGLTLATLDEPLRAAARRVGVSHYKPAK